MTAPDADPGATLAQLGSSVDALGATSPLAAPTPALPKGGGALRGIGEKFTTNTVTGTGTLSVPVGGPGGRGGFGPALSVAYDSGAGNGAFGLGWDLAVPTVSRKTDKGVPRYSDEDESDVFLLSGTEDLVPVTDRTAFPETQRWGRPVAGPFADVERDGYRVRFYRPRVEGLYARIERWTEQHTGRIHWRSVTREDVITVFGPDDSSCVADGPTRIACWLARYSWDDRGNAIVYEFDAEDAAGVDVDAIHERNREAPARTRQRYLRRVRYGNRVPARDVDTWDPCELSRLGGADFLFSVVLDYDEDFVRTEAPDDRGRIAAHPQYTPARPWPVRPDVFSSHRYGFEVRTYRRCTRVLAVHHFPDELGCADYLVHDCAFGYLDSAVASLVGSVRQHQYLRLPDGTWRQQPLPRLDLSYLPRPSAAELSGRVVAELSGVAGALTANPTWVDLDATGAAGVVAEQGGTWYYLANLSPVEDRPDAARLAAPVALDPHPTATLSSGQARFVDLDGDGRPELLDLRAGQRGYFARTVGGWAPFAPLPSWPNLAPDDPDVRFTDLTGDGLSDLLRTADRELQWSAGLGTDGYGPLHTVPAAGGERRGPQLLSADATEAMFLADMSGDGLADLVRVRNGEVAYWPSLGYGRFGRQVIMGGSPRFDDASGFDPRRLRLADTDGTGPTDLVYLAAGGARLHANENGNGWSAPIDLPQVRAGDDPGSVQVIDLLGNGTSCLVWTPGRAGEDARPMRYVPLYHHKPDLLVSIVNNLGAETHLSYAPSSRFALRDAAAGRPWLTRLPFPVQVLEHTLTVDRVVGSLFASRYDYHHGYFDPVEREFRGFGMVEQYDTADLATLGPIGRLNAADVDELVRTASNLGPGSDLPPMLVRTWFHTGAPGPDGVGPSEVDRLTAPLTRDGYRVPGTAEPTPSTLPGRLSADESREAVRALRGQPLRRESYALDGTAQELHPYEVLVHAHVVRCRQRRGPNRHAVFDVHGRESVTYAYERDAADPRTTHLLTLGVDDFGNITASGAIGYGRRRADPALPADVRQRQAAQLVIYNDSDYTNLVDARYARRTPTAWQSRCSELTGLRRFGPGELATAAELRAAVAGAAVLPYEGKPGAGPALRVLGRARVVFRADDLSGPLPLGTQGALGLTAETRRLVLTPGLVAEAYDDPDIQALLAEGGYLADAEGWWIPSGRTFYSATPDGELAAARRHFFTARRYRDPFGAEHHTTYEPHDLLVQETCDPLGNRSTVGERDTDPTRPLVRTGYDYRLLLPALVMGPNRNRAVVAFDPMGNAVASAVMGSPEDDPQPGDSLDGVEVDLGPADIVRALRDGPADPAPWLGSATERAIYDVDSYRRTGQPTVSYTIARETHVADLGPNAQSRLQQAFAYVDGFAQPLQNRSLVENGPAEPEQEQRWVVSGQAVYNAKGMPVRRYEPYFSPSPRFGEFAAGVSTVVVYDPVGRLIATLRPDATWQKATTTAWSKQTWDPNDTMLIDPRADADVGGFVHRLDLPDELSWYELRRSGARGDVERRAAERALAGADTPTTMHVDSLGRPVLTVTRNRVDGEVVEQTARLELDIEGHTRAVVDALGRTVLRCTYDMGGRMLVESTMDGGPRVTLVDVGGVPLVAWDDRGHRFRTGYDVLRRHVASWVRDRTGRETMFIRTVYGEGEPDTERRNLRTQVVEQHDQSGALYSREFDFAGRLLAGERRFAREYRQLIDCGGPVELEPESYLTRTTYDALGRPTTTTAPDGSLSRAYLNQDGLLERLEVVPQGEGEAVVVVADVRYDAHGRRESISFGNGVRTRYHYDPLTFRLVRLRSTRPRDNQRPRVLQDLRCVYDPVGNVMHLADRAQQRAFFRNAVVGSDREFDYDALYRLTSASGREQLGMGVVDGGRAGRADPLGAEAVLARYVETFRYDPVGNLLEQRHRGETGWRRRYEYAEASNRLTRTVVGARTAEYRYDGSAGRHGLITGMTPLASMTWDPFDQLRSTARQLVTDGEPARTWNVYDQAGLRVRTVTDGTDRRMRRERRYVGPFEQFRRYAGDGSVRLERNTLCIADDARRVAALETRMRGKDRSPQRLARWALIDLAGSVGIEVDDRARLIGYEEYYAFGETSLRRLSRRVEAPNRYRFAGQERDRDSGLYHSGARYFMPWLGRWTAPDPGGLVDGTNRYAYVRNNPLKYNDSSGLGCDPANQCCVDPTATTSAEDAAQACLPADDSQEANSCQQPDPPPAAPVHLEAPDFADHWTLGPRGERFRAAGYTGPVRDHYTKPWAMAAAAAGNTEFAETAENYLCATCHIVAHYGHVPTNAEYSAEGYARRWQRGYVEGGKAVALGVGGALAPEIVGPAMAWETGVSTGEYATGDTSGLHISDLVTGHAGESHHMSSDERTSTGVSAAIGWVSLGVGYGMSRVGGAPSIDEPPPTSSGLTEPPANPTAYSTAYQTRLDPSVWGRSRSVHFNRANAALDADLAASPEFAAQMEELIPGVRQSVARAGGRQTPDGWTWEHASSSTASGQQGVMRLVPTPQHTPGSPFWRVLHPNPGAAGGYSEWAIPNGAPANGGD